MTLLAAAATAAAIYICFAYADRVEKVLGRAGTDIAVRLLTLILFCIGVQILWAGASELLSTLPVNVGPAATWPGGRRDRDHRERDRRVMQRALCGDC
jgi:hypothetical protein